MPIFDERVDPSDSDAFLAWIAVTPHGYYLNVRSEADVVLHRGRCYHIEFNEPRRLTRARKIAAVNREPLMHWASANGITHRECADCLRLSR